MRHRVLIVEDDPSARRGLQALAAAWGYEAHAAADGAEALDDVAGQVPAVVVTDLVMPGLDGMGLLIALKRDHPGTPVIVLTGQGSVETAVQAMKDGAYDYLTKPVDPERLQLLLEKAVERTEATRELTILRRQLRQRGAYGPMVAGAASMLEITRQMELVAATDATVFVLGESGTGKELVARTVHEQSPRRRGPFVALNCAAIPDSLLESEIFGHEKGAFTGAAARRQGCFELADGGTLLLDEVAEMQPATQVKFLRVLQEGRFRRLGGSIEVTVDVRVVAATNQDPAKAVAEGALREDLYYRLNVFTIALPPLRERMEDLDELIKTFLSEFNERHQRSVRGVDEATRSALRGYAWPGNIRELRNVLERAVIMCPGDLVTLAHLPAPAAPGLSATTPLAVSVAAFRPPGRPSGAPEPPGPPDRPDSPGEPDSDVRLPVGTTVDEAERRLVLRTLQHTGNNKTRAAEILGISLKTLHNKLHKYNA